MKNLCPGFGERQGRRTAQITRVCPRKTETVQEWRVGEVVNMILLLFYNNIFTPFLMKHLRCTIMALCVL